MMMRTLIKQTMLLSASHFFVRMLGFILRIWLSRELGAQAMGLVELAQSAQMLLITPVVSGLPSAVSRMCAKADEEKQSRILRVAAIVSLCFSIPAAAAAYFLRIPLSLWLGDIRTLPALLIYLPCIPILGLSCALNGYHYGKGNPAAPAASEILEQIVRLLLCMRLVSIFKSWPMAVRSAIPAAAALIGETAGFALILLLSLRALFGIHSTGGKRQILREMLRLALPLTGMRIVSSLMRTANAVLIPARLQTAGLSGTEALSRLGMINGMLMPILSLPSFITCSLSMISGPELARRQSGGKPVRMFIKRILTGTVATGIAASAAVYALAPVFSDMLYKQAALLPLLRRCSLLVPVMALTQVTNGMMNGLGLQSISLKISLISNTVSAITTYVLAAQPRFTHWGVILAISLSQLLTLALNLHALKYEAKQQPERG